jgi:CRP-like cAMP-binding protein
MHPVLLFLNSIYPLSSGCIDALEDLIQETEIKKRGFILKAGQVCTNIYFIHSGLMRSFIKEGDKIICRWFMKEGDIIISIKSFYNQVRSEEYIQALEQCTLSYISFADLEKIYKNFLEFNYVGRILTQKYYQLWDEQLKALHHPAPERYLWLKENHPQLIQRVSTEDIASYLGITREHLQRIKYKV